MAAVHMATQLNKEPQVILETANSETNYSSSCGISLMKIIKP